MATHVTGQASHDDPTHVDPKHYTIEVENEQIRVLRVRYGPHEKSEMHAHPAIVAIMLTDARLGMSYPDGRTEEIGGKAGEVMSMPATVHLPENLSDQTFEAILIELKK